MNTKVMANVGTIAFMMLFASTGIAAAGVLDPITNLANDIFADLQSFVTVIGGIAFIVGVIMMMFGQGNAWKLCLTAFLIVIGVNASDIVSSIAGV